MNRRLVIFLAALIAPVLFAQPSRPAAPAAPKGSAPAAPAPAAKEAADAKKQEEPPPKIEGMEIVRPKGGYLGLELLNNNFVLTFYDKEKKKMPADMQRAALRWPVKYQPADERTVLNPGGEPSILTSGKIVRPPHNFRLTITLLSDSKEVASENHIVDFRK